jgi:hypothetical protein
MKTRIILAVISLIVILSGCTKKEDIMMSPNGSSSNNNNNNNGYVWSGCNPEPISFISSAKVSGYTDVWDYNFLIKLNNSQTNPVGVNLFAPHVGPGGALIYTNANNDATYTITSTEAGNLYLTIRTSDCGSAGCRLKFNVSVGEAPNAIWFVADGYGAPGVDNGSTNIYSILFKSGTVSP